MTPRGSRLGVGVALALALALGHLFLHLNRPSTLSGNNGWQRTTAEQRLAVVTDTVVFNETIPYNAKRVLATTSVRGLQRLTGDLWLAYITFVALSTFAAGVSLWLAMGRLQLSTAEAVAGLLLYFTSFSVLFSHFTPIYSYNEFLLYLCLFAAVAFMGTHPLRVALLFCLAMLARETCLLLVPGAAVAAYWASARTGLKARLAAAATILVVPAGFYLLAFVALMRFPDVPGRFDTLWWNFGDVPHAVESLLSLPLALGVALPLAIYAARRWRSLSTIEQALLLAFFVSVILNSAVAYPGAKVREARVLAWPLIFIWPLIGRWLVTWWRARGLTRRPRLLVGVGLVAAVAIWPVKRLLEQIYVATCHGDYGSYQRYLATLVVLGLVLVVLRLVSPRVSKTTAAAGQG
jgi:hypothetical protein